MLFANGASNFNTLEHLSYIMFFVAFSANMELYRKGASLLIMFVSFFIFAQYVYSLVYFKFPSDNDTRKVIKWFGLYDEGHYPDWHNKTTSIYFRYKPSINKFVLLIVMNLLVSIN